MWSRNPPERVFILPGAEMSASKSASGSHRDSGASVIASTPSRSSRQKAPGLGAPGKRQATPTIAIGSASFAGAFPAGRRGAAGAAPAGEARWRARASGVECSQIRRGDRGRPSIRESSSMRAAAPCESIP
ncbi:hypothetical protein BE11_35480 [Sorangium cellulosum]|nr:hypothetical protein BE11_35480 [Sorangium cellulosum]